MIVYFPDDPYSCRVYISLDDDAKIAAIAYLLFNDPLALVELGFPPDKVQEYRDLFIAAEEQYVTYYPIVTSSVPTPSPPVVSTPTPPTQPSPGTFYTSAPFEVQNGQVYVSGTFANVSIAANGEIIITSIFSGRRQLSDVARVQNYSGSSIPSSNPLAKAAISGGKPVYCGEYFVTAYNLVKTSANSIGVSSTFSTDLLVRIMGNMYKDSNGNVRIKNSPSFSLMPLRIYSPGGADVTLTVTTVPVSILVL